GVNNTPAGQKQHALMFMDRVDYPVQQAYSLGEREVTVRDPRRLAESSGVVVLTPTDHILGNVYENQDINEINSFPPRFKATSQSVGHVMRKSNPIKPFARFDPAAMTPQLAHDTDEWDESLVLYLLPPTPPVKRGNGTIIRPLPSKNSEARHLFIFSVLNHNHPSPDLFSMWIPKITVPNIWRHSLVLATPSNTSSSSREGSPSKLPVGIFTGMKIKIIDAKLTPKVVAELSDMAEENGGRLIANADKADVVVTEIGSRIRLERHITWEAA
ncbi:9367_t:CDS:2, partial [Acaulospora colombiana]